MKKMLIILFLSPLFLFAQEVGIHFEHNTDWQKVKEKAKAEDKFIFVDCYTTWCGPCIWMADNVFPQEEVGRFFNKNFVNLKIQMDVTPKDDEDVKAWYDMAKQFTSEYQLRGFPTFLIFNADGELVHRVSGGLEADSFIEQVGKSLNPETQYVALLKAFEKNPNDEKIVKNMANAAFSAYELEVANRATAAYLKLASAEDIISKDNINLILYNVNSTTAPMYSLVRDNMALLDKVLREANNSTTANDILASVLITEIVNPQIIESKPMDPDFEAIRKSVEKDHPYVKLNEAIEQSKIQYYMDMKNWPAFKDAVNNYVASKDNAVFPELLNHYAYLIFKNCDDPGCLSAALTWSKLSLGKGEIAMFLVTYANLLYKSGDTENAISWQEKAIKVASTSDKEKLQNVLAKMQAGKPTWN